MLLVYTEKCVCGQVCAVCVCVYVCVDRLIQSSQVLIREPHDCMDYSLPCGLDLVVCSWLGLRRPHKQSIKRSTLEKAVI